MRTLFQLDDGTTGDGIEIAHDAATDRLFVRSRIDAAGERVLVVLDAHRVGLEISDALRDALREEPSRVEVG